MTKEKFHKTWQYRLLQVFFWGTLVLFSITLTLMGIFGSDVEIAGLVWSVVLAFVYWVAKRIFYYVMFNESILPKKK